MSPILTKNDQKWQKPFLGVPYMFAKIDHFGWFPVNSHPLLRMRQVPTFYDLSFPSYGGSKVQRSKFSTFFKRAKNLFLDLLLGVEFISAVKKLQKLILFEIHPNIAYG